MMKVFIDGGAGTTGLRIADRLKARADLTLLTLPEALRRDVSARRDQLNAADAAFLCLPDEAAVEAVSLVENPNTVVLDASTAHRVNPAWAYGFPELSDAHEAKIKASKRVAVPGCHASGFIALVYPLIEAGLIDQNALLSCHSLTGYSGGGKNMIAQYELSDDALLSAPRQYGLNQNHKHLREMRAVTGLNSAPAFCPIVAPFYCGMEVTVPLFLNDTITLGAIRDVYRSKYQGGVVRYAGNADEGGFLSAAALSGRDSMEISVYGNDERAIAVARYDNLGKGASGAAIECMNLALGLCPTTSLIL